MFSDRTKKNKNMPQSVSREAEAEDKYAAADFHNSCLCLCAREPGTFQCL